MTFSLVSKKFLGVRNIALYSVPPAVHNLPLILLKDSKNLEKSKEFKVNGTNIRNALLWLKKNNPY